MSKKPANHSTSAALPKIAVIGTGGTISAVGWSPLDLIDYNRGRNMGIEEPIRPSNFPAPLSPK